MTYEKKGGSRQIELDGLTISDSARPKKVNRPLYKGGF